MISASGLKKAIAGLITGSGLTQGTGKLLGRGTAGTGGIEEITLGTNLSLTGTTLNASGGISNIVTATTATTLTSTPTLLQITPSDYGVTVTLPDATACSLGGPTHVINNKGAYPVMIVNPSNQLLGFLAGMSTSYVSLSDNSSAAGTWALSNVDLFGVSARLPTTSFSTRLYNDKSSIDLGGGREIVFGSNANDYPTAIVYDKASGFGSPTVIRSGSCGANARAILVSTDKILFISSITTAFEAVVISISGSTISVGTPATATLSGNISSFADGCGLITSNGSFVASYTTASSAAEIRAISVSGTTPTIGSATSLDGTAAGLISASASGIIAVSSATTNLYTKYYGISGSTITAGSGTTTTSGTMTINKFVTIGAYWAAIYNDGGSTIKGAIISLSGTATTISIATLLSSSTLADAIIINSTKILAISNATSSNTNILTNATGTASAGTAITGGSADTSGRCIYVNGSNVYAQWGDSPQSFSKINCSGASPVLSDVIAVASNNNYAQSSYYPSASNSAMLTNGNGLIGSDYAISIYLTSRDADTCCEITAGHFRKVLFNGIFGTTTFTRGKSLTESWGRNSNLLVKMECIS